MGGNNRTRIQRILPLGVWLKFWFWKQFRIDCALKICTTTGLKLIIRQRPTTDLGIIREVFGAEIYACPFPMKKGEMQSIVDLGANVGYGVLYWFDKYPNIKIHAFEPHPINFKIATQHMELNSIPCGQIKLMPVAAGSVSAVMYITDEGAGSRVVDAPESGATKIELIDVFDYIDKVGPIDLLKIDIEGGEYALLSDVRFTSLTARVIALEFHPNRQFSDPKAFCIEKLSAAGYVIHDASDTDAGNMLWGLKTPFADGSEASARGVFVPVGS
jgi:FkbM family methyltransferase